MSVKPGKLLAVIGPVGAGKVCLKNYSEKKSKFLSRCIIEPQSMSEFFHFHANYDTLNEIFIFVYDYMHILMKIKLMRIFFEISFL